MFSQRESFSARIIIWHIKRSFCDKSDGLRFRDYSEFLIKKNILMSFLWGLFKFSILKRFFGYQKHVFRKSPMFGVEMGLFLMLISRKTSSKSGTLDQTCTAHFQLWWNTINLSLKCQNKPVILMRLDSWHNSREFQENFKIWNGIFREVSWSIRVKLQFFILILTRFFHHKKP